MPKKMEQTECSEMSAYKIQVPGNYPEESIKHYVYNFWNGEGIVSTENVSHNIRCDMQVSQNNYVFLSHCSWCVFSLTQVNWNTCRKICSTKPCPPHISHGLAWGQTQDSMVRCLWLTVLVMVWPHLQRCTPFTTWRLMVKWKINMPLWSGLNR